jgi:hypothetical protein
VIIIIITLRNFFTGFRQFFSSHFYRARSTSLFRSSPCICAASDKPSNLCDNSRLALFTFMCQAKLPSRCSYRKKLSFKFFALLALL